MWEFLKNLISAKNYIPHGHCYLWQTPLVGLHVTSDLLIAIAYFSIPTMLFYFIFKRSDVPFSNVFIMLGAFIFLCGTGHLLEIWTLWHPDYWLSGAEQAVTAVVSCYTAMEMATLLPRFLSLKTPEQLEAVNRELQNEILERKKVEAELQQSAERKQAITRIVQRMRQTLDLETIFADTTEELRHGLACERVLIYQLNSDWSGKVVAESVAEGWTKVMSQETQNNLLNKVAIDRENCAIQTIKDTYLQESQGEIFSQKNSYRQVNNIYEANFDECYMELLEELQAKSYLAVPIFQSEPLWGLLFAYQLSAPRQWQEGEIQIMIQVGVQLGVAVQQAGLLARTQQQAQELRAAKNEAEKANCAKSEFLANMSHELRTPLNAILGYTQLMQRSSKLSPEDRKYIEIIDRSGEHLLNQINDVLEMSKIEAGQNFLNESSFDLDRMLTELENIFKLKAQLKQIKLSFKREGSVPQYIKTDRTKLRQILINIISNAIKFTERGQITLSVWVEEQKLFFAIEDTGPGITPQAIEKIFDPFKQGEAGLQSGGGTGLGLTISRMFVLLMDGEISVSSELGKGALFVVSIPLSIGKPVLDRQLLPVYRHPIALAREQPEFRILIAEDKQTNRDLLVQLLTSVGFKVREAVNGQEAIAIWESWEPHLIWMDMQMPVMKGFEAIKHIKASLLGQSTVIIALTASVFEEERQTILSYGCDDFVRKPFRSEELFEKMAQYLGVKYIYEDDDRSDNNAANLDEDFSLDAESLKVMPPEWIEEVYKRAS